MSPQGPAKAVVRVDTFGLVSDILNPVRNVEHCTGKIHAEPTDTRIGSAVCNHFTMLRQYPAIFVGSSTEPNLHRMAHVSDGKYLVHRVDQFHRPASLFRKNDRTKIHRHRFLLASGTASTDKGLHNADVAEFDAKPHR